MRLIVGLGNPGPEYQFTPHNAGFLAIDRLAQVCGVSVSNRRGKAQTAKATLAGQEVLLAKPETFMKPEWAFGFGSTWRPGSDPCGTHRAL